MTGLMAAEVALSRKPSRYARTTGRPRQFVSLKRTERDRLITLSSAAPLADVGRRHAKTGLPKPHRPTFSPRRLAQRASPCAPTTGALNESSNTMAKNNGNKDNGGSRSGGSNNNGGGWPSKNPGQPSGGGRDNNPPRRK